MTLNLEGEVHESTECNWTPLQIEVVLNVALAKRQAFIDAANWLAGMVRLKIITQTTAADALHESAAYNQLYFEYGKDPIQKIMSDALSEAAA